MSAKQGMPSDLNTKLSTIPQEALLEASQKLDQYNLERPIPFLPWLRQFAWNRLVNLHRTHLAQKRDISREADWQLSDHSVRDLAKLLVAGGASPSWELRRSELNQRVRHLLAGMKPSDREILILRHLEGLSVTEVAAVVGITEQAAKKRQVRALLRLRQQLNTTTGWEP